MDSGLVFLRNRVILNQWTKWNNRSFKLVSQNVFHMEFSHQTGDLECFADKYSIPWNPHNNVRPILLATISQMFLLYSAHCSLSNPICFWSVWCWRAMIPGEIFTSFAKFQRIVKVNDFWFPLSFQELLQASLGFLWSFGFARIRLDPLGGQVLHHDCISMIVSRFAIVA